MSSVQELIALGKVPSDTKSADNQTGYPNGWPIFSDLSKQVAYDWNNLPSDRVRSLKNQPDYKAALEAFLLADSAPTTVETPEGQTQTLALSPEESILEGKKNETTVVTEVPTTTAEVVETPVITEEPEGTKSGPYTKVKGGWEARVEAIDGSGTQVYFGKTKDELSEKVLTAQAHASAKIRQQQQLLDQAANAKEQEILDEPAEIAQVRRRLAPRQMTAEEQFDFAEALKSDDPVRINKAFSLRDKIMLGAPIDEIVGQVNETRDALELASYRSTAKQFVDRNKNVSNFAELGAPMGPIDQIIAHGDGEGKAWAYTVRNLEKALAILKKEGKVQYKQVSTPAAPRELPVPTSAREAVVTPAVVAVPTAPVVTPAAKTNQPAAGAPPQTEARLRPGSASTGVSPRQASVRQGATPASPVGLTVEEYNRMSVSETRRKYNTDLGFKSAVDKLMAEGKI